MSTAATPAITGGRRSILDLAPLELDCMNALWPLGEATVRDIQEALLHSRPRAYTTILTIMDRLAQKGTVVRRKTGRAWVYRPSLSADEARSHAVSQVIEGFFDGSAEALAMHLSARVSGDDGKATRRAVPRRRAVSPQGPERVSRSGSYATAAPVSNSSTSSDVSITSSHAPELDTSLL